MRHLLLIASALLLLPLSALAQEPTAARDIELPSLKKPALAWVELDAEALQSASDKYLVINAESVAVGSERIDDDINVMSEATFDRVPAAADTVPKTTVDSLRDGNPSTYFQPQTGREFVFAFHVQETIRPTSLSLALSEGSLESVHVRLGLTPSTLKDAAVGASSSNSIGLSGEQARYFEVTVRIDRGVLRVDELSLLAARTRILFAAKPSEQYRLLYGPEYAGEHPVLGYAQDRSEVQGFLGASRAARTDEQGDHDGVPDASDNCTATWNPQQEDEDKDGLGNICDTCPTVANPDQASAVCGDDDQDGIINATDNCPVLRNPAQADEDQDGVGNACDGSDDRWSEDRPWLLYASMALIILALTAMGGMILMRSKKE